MRRVCTLFARSLSAGDVACCSVFCRCHAKWQINCNLTSNRIGKCATTRQWSDAIWFHLFVICLFFTLSRCPSGSGSCRNKLTLFYIARLMAAVVARDWFRHQTHIANVLHKQWINHKHKYFSALFACVSSTRSSRALRAFWTHSNARSFARVFVCICGSDDRCLYKIFTFCRIFFFSLLF